MVMLFTQWKEDVYSFINHNIAPVSIACTVQQLYDALLSQLCTFCGVALPTIHEFTNVATLLQYKESFCADFRTGTSQHRGDMPLYKIVGLFYRRPLPRYCIR